MGPRLCEIGLQSYSLFTSCRQENTISQPHFHTTTFRASLYGRRKGAISSHYKLDHQIVVLREARRRGLRKKSTMLGSKLIDSMQWWSLFMDGPISPWRSPGPWPYWNHTGHLIWLGPSLSYRQSVWKAVLHFYRALVFFSHGGEV